MKLRDYQHAMIDGARAHMRAGAKRVLVQAPTGAGKTVVACEIIRSAVAKGRTVWFSVHRRELMEQALESLGRAGIRAGTISRGSSSSEQVSVASIATLARRQNLKRPDLLVVDEAHHAISRTWAEQIELQKGTVIGLSATPARLDGRGLGRLFQALVLGPTTGQLIDSGSLSPYRLFAPSTVDMTGVRSQSGDWARAEAADRARTITGSAVASYKRLSNGRAIAYCCTVKHCQETAEEFAAAGISAAYVDGSMPVSIRSGIIAAFRSGSVLVLVSCDLISEGFDVPAADCAIMLRPTESLTLYLQQAGRVLRPADGKTAIILDHVGNAGRHGMPCDERQWSLEDGVRTASAYESPISLCKSCYAAQKPTRVCRYCGEDMGEPAKKRTPAEIEGELVELMAARAQATLERRMARGFDELVALGRSRGYKNPVAWATHVARGRQRR